MVKHLKVEDWCQNMVLAVAHAWDPRILYMYHSVLLLLDSSLLI